MAMAVTIIYEPTLEFYELSDPLTLLAPVLPIELSYGGR